MYPGPMLDYFGGLCNQAIAAEAGNAALVDHGPAARVWVCEPKRTPGPRAPGGSSFVAYRLPGSVMPKAAKRLATASYSSWVIPSLSSMMNSRCALAHSCQR